MNLRIALATVPAALVLTLAGCSSGSPAMEKAATATTPAGTAMDKPSDAMAKPSDAMAKPSDSAMSKPTQSAMSPNGTGAMAAGAYLTLADYQATMAMHAGDKVVYFFHATWCPDCKAADAELTSTPGQIPAGVTIVKVDYDSNVALRQKYGVTMQHTYVLLDSTGGAVKKWTSPQVGTVLADLKS